MSRSRWNRRLRGRRGGRRCSPALLLLALGAALAGDGARAQSAREAAPPEPVEIVSIRLVQLDSGHEVEIRTDRPSGLVGMLVDAEESVEVQLPRHRPRPGVTGLLSDSGLVAAVEVSRRQRADGPLTRIVVRTRRPAVPTLAREGSVLRLRLREEGEAPGETASALRARIAGLEREVGESRRQNQTLASRVDVLTDERAELARRFEELAGSRQSVSAGLAAAQQEIDRLRAERAERIGELESRLEAARKAAEDQRAQAAAEAAELTRALDEAAARENDLSARLAGLEASLAESEATAAELAAQLDSARAGEQETQAFSASLTAEVDRLAAALAEQQAARQEAETALEAERLQIARLEEQVSKAAVELERAAQGAEGRAAELADRLAALEASLAEAEAASAEASSALAASQAAERELAERLDLLGGEREALSGEVGELIAARDRLAAELETANADLERLRGEGMVRGRTTGRVNLRSGPGTDHAVIALLEAGTLLEVMSRGAGWVQVGADAGRGWISGEFLELEDDRIAQLEGELAAARAELDATRGAAAGEAEALRAELADAAAQRAADVDALAELEAERRDLVAERDAAQAEAAGLADRLAAREADLAEAAESAGSRDAALQARLTELEAAQAEALAANAELEGSLAASRAAEEALGGRAESLAGEAQALRDEIATLTAGRDEVAARLAEAESDLARLRGEGMVRGRTNGRVNLRSGPGTDHAVIALLEAGTLLEVMGRGEGWIQVRADAGRGWISGEFLELEDDRIAQLESELAAARQGLDERTRAAATEAEEMRARLASQADADAERSAALAELESRSAALAAELEAARAEVARLEESTGAAGAELAAAEEEGRRRAEAAAELEAARRELETQLAAAEAARGELAVRLEAAEAAARAGREEQSSAAAESEAQAQAMAELEERRTALELELAETRAAAQRQADRLGARVAELEQALADAGARASDRNERATGLEAELARALAANAELTTRLEALETGARRRESELEAAAGERGELRGEIDELTAERDRLAADLARTRADLERVREGDSQTGRTARRVNLRAGPGTDQPVVTVLEAGMRLEVMGREGDWLEVLADAGRGWVAASFVELVDDRVAALEAELAAARGELKEARRGADSQSEELRARLAGSSSEREELLARLAAIEAGHAELDSQVKALRGENEALWAKSHQDDARLASARATVDRLTAELERLRQGAAAASPPAGSETEPELEVPATGPPAVAPPAGSAEPPAGSRQADAEPPPETEPQWALTTARVNLRSGPGTEHPVLTLLPESLRVEVLERRQSWARVLSGGVEGWVHADFLEPYPG